MSARVVLCGLACGMLCAQTVVHRDAAGRDAAGNELTVVRQHYPQKQPSEKRCIPGEKFVLEKARAGRVVSSEALLTFCQSEDEADTTVTVEPNSITVARNGGSHAGYYTTSSYQLSPWKALQVEACSFTAGSGEFTVESWDFAKLRGQAWTGLSDEAGGICVQDGKVFPYLVIPEIHFDVGRLQKGASRLGGCALSMDASGENGFVIFGKRDAQDPVEVKLLFADKHTLVAQVIDPTRSGKAASSWVNGDHFEIWMAAHGVMASADTLWQFGIPVDEGPVQVGYGKPPKLPVVSRWTSKLPDGRTAALMSIELPPYPSQYSDGLTVVYSQGLEGRAQKRMIATSRVKRGREQTIGTQDSVVRQMEYTQCSVVQGALEMTGAPKKPLEVPLPIGGLSEPEGTGK